jgi:hypothetical protein
VNKKIKILLITSFASCFQLNVIAQSHAIQTDLSKSSYFQVINRNISILNEQSKVVVHLDAREGAGVAWLNNTTFDKGVIEFDEKGKNVVQQSFIGIAFHGLNDSTYDCIYFRPFNFQGGRYNKEESFGAIYFFAAVRLVHIAKELSGQI